MWTIRVLVNGEVTELPPFEGTFAELVQALANDGLNDSIVAIVLRR